MTTENDALMEIVHLASAALVADLPEVKRKALADIADAVAGLLPVEMAGRLERAGRGDRARAKFVHVNTRFMNAMSVTIPNHKLTGCCELTDDGYWNGEIELNGQPFGSVCTYHGGKHLTSRMLLFAMRGAASHFGHKPRLRRNRCKGNPDFKRGILSMHEELARTVAGQKEGL